MTRSITAVLAAATLLAMTASTQAQPERGQKLLGQCSEWKLGASIACWRGSS